MLCTDADVTHDTSNVNTARSFLPSHAFSDWRCASLVLTRVSFCADATGSDPREVALAMRGYIVNFFGCRECAKNFQKEAVSLEKQIDR